MRAMLRTLAAALLSPWSALPGLLGGLAAFALIVLASHQRKKSTETSSCRLQNRQQYVEQLWSRAVEAQRTATQMLSGQNRGAKP